MRLGAIGRVRSPYPRFDPAEISPPTHRVFGGRSAQTRCAGDATEAGRVALVWPVAAEPPRWRGRTRRQQPVQVGVRLVLAGLGGPVLYLMAPDGGQRCPVVFDSGVVAINRNPFEQIRRMLVGAAEENQPMVAVRNCETAA